MNPSPVRGVDIDDVVAGAFRADRGVAVPAPEVGDVFFAGAPRLLLFGSESDHGHMRGADRRHATVEVRRVGAVVGEFGAGEGAAFVYFVGDAGERGDVVVVPEAQFHIGRDVRGRMHFNLLGADDAPAALGFHAAHFGARRDIAVAHSVAVRDLVEAIFRDFRPYGDGFKQHIVPRISCHGNASL